MPVSFGGVSGYNSEIIGSFRLKSGLVGLVASHPCDKYDK